MIDVFYINSKNEKINFRGPAYIITDKNNLGDWEWNYEVTNNVIKNMGRQLKDKSMQLLIKGDSEEDCNRLKNELIEKTEFDLYSQNNGKLYVGDYYIECYLIGKEIDNSIIGKSAIETLTILPNSKAWIKKVKKEFNPDTEVMGAGHGYPFEYPYGYSLGSGYTASITNEGCNDVDMIIEIYGYAYHPEIVIGGHSYKLNFTIEKNQKAVINTKDRTIKLYDLQNGTVKNLFMYRDKTNNIFEKLYPGEHSIFWNQNYNFDITILYERSEPEWM